MKACVVTPYRADQEPRAPRHARLLASMRLFTEVYFVDCAPDGDPPCPESVELGARVKTSRCFYPTRQSNSAARVAIRASEWVSRHLYPLTSNAAFGPAGHRSFLLSRALRRIRPDVVIGHNIESLSAICLAPGPSSRRVVFDSMEYYSDMGDGQTKMERVVVKALETRFLSKCHLVLASSEQVGEALRERYGIADVLALYNAPPLQSKLQKKPTTGLHLYWRNSTIGLGQRGLGTVLDAMPELPGDVVLHIQGRKPLDPGGLHGKLASPGLRGRVVVHDPFEPGNAVWEASGHHVGLCPELDTCENQRLTVSNKLFDYMMGGLAVVGSNLPGIGSVVRTAASGILVNPGDPRALAEAVLRLYRDRELLAEFSANALRYAWGFGNEEHQMGRLRQALEGLALELSVDPSNEANGPRIYPGAKL